MTEWLFVGIGTTFLMVLAWHYIALDAGLVNPDNWFKRAVIYVGGVGSIICGIGIWRVVGFGDWLTPVALFAHAAAGGIGVLVGYGLRRIFMAFKRESKAERDIKRRFPNELD